MAVAESRQQRAKAFLAFLDDAYPASACSLRHESAFELLVATILSAQTTDKRVNEVMPGLMNAFGTPEALANASVESVMDHIRTVGLFRNKAKSLVKMAKSLVDNHGGEVPQSRDELITLAGVGRKTANVVLGNVFGVPAMVVDTHVGRIAGRLGLTDHDDPVKVEKDLMDILPEERWTMFSHQVIDFGRETCTAKKPHCSNCGMRGSCPWYDEYMKTGTGA